MHYKNLLLSLCRLDGRNEVALRAWNFQLLQISERNYLLSEAAAAEESFLLVTTVMAN